MKNEKLSKLLNIEPIDVTSTELGSVEPEKQVENDAQFARENIRGLIDKGGNALDSLLRVAKESEHPIPLKL